MLLRRRVDSNLGRPEETFVLNYLTCSCVVVCRLYHLGNQLELT